MQINFTLSDTMCTASSQIVCIRLQTLVYRIYIIFSNKSQALKNLNFLKFTFYFPL